MRKYFKHRNVSDLLSYFIFIFVFIFVFISNSWATFPVIDVSAIFQLKKEISFLDESYQELQSQYATLQQQYHTMIGNYNWGSWKNDASTIKQNLDWAPPDWNQALQNLSGGNPGRYQELLKTYQANHLSLSQETYSKGSEKNLATDYQNQVATNQVSAATTSAEFNDISRHLSEIQQLGEEIENKTQNGNLKSAIDLNSRIELEVAYISMEELRMQAVLNQQTAALSASHVAQESEASMFNSSGQ